HFVPAFCGTASNAGTKEPGLNRRTAPNSAMAAARFPGVCARAHPGCSARPRIADPYAPLCGIRRWRRPDLGAFSKDAYPRLLCTVAASGSRRSAVRYSAAGSCSWSGTTHILLLFRTHHIGRKLGTREKSDRPDSNLL